MRSNEIKNLSDENLMQQPKETFGEFHLAYTCLRNFEAHDIQNFLEMYPNLIDKDAVESFRNGEIEVGELGDIIDEAIVSEQRKMIENGVGDFWPISIERDSAEASNIQERLIRYGILSVAVVELEGKADEEAGFGFVAIGDFTFAREVDPSLAEAYINGLDSLPPVALDLTGLDPEAPHASTVVAAGIEANRRLADACSSMADELDDKYAKITAGKTRHSAPRNKGSGGPE